jgi:beta-glucosidase
MNKTGDIKVRPIRLFTAFLWLMGSAAFGQQTSDAPYLDPDLSPEHRAVDLVSRMTLEEKVLQMQSTAPAIPHLNVPA